MNNSPFKLKKVILATTFRSKKELLSEGVIGDTADFHNGHDHHEIEITHVDGEGNKVTKHRKNGEDVE